MTVIVHGKESCAPCHTLKYWLNKKGITYKYIEGGARIFPTVKVGGETIEGLNFHRLNQLLSAS